MARAAGAPLSEKPLSVTPPNRAAIAIPMTANAITMKIESRMTAMRRSPIPATRNPPIRGSGLEAASWTRAAGGGGAAAGGAAGGRAAAGRGEGGVKGVTGVAWTGGVIASGAPQNLQKRAASPFGFPHEPQSMATSG